MFHSGPLISPYPLGLRGFPSLGLDSMRDEIYAASTGVRHLIIATFTMSFTTRHEKIA